MDSDQKSNTSDSNIDDESDFYDGNESDLEIDEEELAVGNGNEEEDASETEDEEEFKWNWDGNYSPDTIFTSKEVKGHTTITLTNSIRPIDVFNKFFTQDVFDLIVQQTNIYGKQKFLEQESASNWQNVDERIIRSFLGILIIMGLHQLPRITDYWSRNKIFHTEVIANVMPRTEFQRIFTALHLADNTKQNQFAKSSKKFKLFKVFDFISLLKRNFQVNFILGTNICIDESMIKFKGKSSFK
jgi:hypothetical protein